MDPRPPWSVSSVSVHNRVSPVSVGRVAPTYSSGGSHYNNTTHTTPASSGGGGKAPLSGHEAGGHLRSEEGDLNRTSTPAHLSLSHSHSIRHEIQRFESVHPSIYAIYDLIELIPDPLLAQQVREHVVSIEDSFVNSQEWTLSRGVPDLRLGIVGSLSSGKSALVHRYLTGSYMQEESPEGGRFKKEVVVGNRSYLLLIRDEGGPPEHQFSHWVDAVIFVFNLESEASFNAILDYYHKISQFRNLQSIPIILVGTQDVLSDCRPRVIDDLRARKLAFDLNQCAYYETCATYGLNVERVFQEACQKITLGRDPVTKFLPANGIHHDFIQGPGKSFRTSPDLVDKRPRSKLPSPGSGTSFNEMLDGNGVLSNALDSCSLGPDPNESSEFPSSTSAPLGTSGGTANLTPTLTPTSSRKNRRRSNLFTPHKKNQEEKQSVVPTNPTAQLGSGRSIPIRQGYLYKRTNNSFSRDWKKKYVTLSNDGRMTYHPSLHDYMENVHGKEILLQYVTVKVPGQKPRGSRVVVSSEDQINSQDTNISIANSTSHFGSDKKSSEKVLLTGFERIKESITANEEAESPEKNPIEASNGKKRLRKLKNNGVKVNPDAEDLDNCEFHIVSLDNRQWQFETTTGLEAEKIKSKGSEENCSVLLRTDALGNLACADCGNADPDWASINMGVLVCIECSGVHRQLGSHISRVRSLELDEWPAGHIAVMTALGNRLANSVLEDRLPPNRKPGPMGSQKDKEAFIIAKYKDHDYLKPLPNGYSKAALFLTDSILGADVKGVLHALLHCFGNELNSSINPPHDERTPLHIAYDSRNIAISQLLVWAHSGLHNQNISTNPKDDKLISRLEKSFFTHPNDNIELS
ncbi:hypothetical protein TCAL_06823 [Tigriopus californicus]|uniref:Centaurin-gamma-1A n=1 Tax=Tigriopus californicus TaxID=6832 RepID=A0A553NTG6_TIGCA|nr:hypothetical protein TCAL_06823 [Tigriopus californicus]